MCSVTLTRNFLLVTKNKTLYYGTCQTFLWRCVCLRHAQLILQCAL